MSQLNLALAAVGGLLLVLGPVAGLIGRHTFLSEPLVALLFGVLLGPGLLGLLDLASWGNREIILEEAARLTSAIAVLGVTLRLPEGYPLRR